jgi:AcrR family transcriptional regulator
MNPKGKPNSLKPSKSKAAQSGVSDRKSRKSEIIESLRRCMLSKGYAETTITDIARDADMALSHLLYYYPTKEAVLLDLAHKLHEGVLAGIRANDEKMPPKERIALLVNNLFVTFPREELSLLRQMVAASMHSAPLHENLSMFASRTVGYLEDLFGSAPRQSGVSATEAAEFAGAAWMGLLINAAFTVRLSESDARRMFGNMLTYLANFDAEPAAAGAKPAPRKARRARMDSV